jgi:hypothetical protein
MATQKGITPRAMPSDHSCHQVTCFVLLGAPMRPVVTTGSMREPFDSDRDAKAFDYYDDPARREAASGRPHRRPHQPLTEHVPVRFPAETIAEVRRLAEADGMTVSAWIRRAVDRTVRRQMGADMEPVEGAEDTRMVVERLQRDVAELAAALDRSGSR